MFKSIIGRQGRSHLCRSTMNHQPCRFASKKAGGTSSNGRDSAGRRLGVKKFGGEVVIPGNIIIRQRGTKYYPGDGVGMGKDHTLFAKNAGHVMFRKIKGFNRKKRQYVSIVTSDEWEAFLNQKHEENTKVKRGWVGQR